MRTRFLILRLLVAAALAVALAACGRPAPVVPVAGGLQLPDAVRVRVGGVISTVALEDYVLGTVLAEIGSARDTPRTVASIYQLQAIITRTYATYHRTRHAKEGFDLCDETHCQVFRPERVATSPFAAVARRAVADTRGQVLVYGARPVEALFHADCGGHTADAEVVWGGRVPYLLGTADDVPAETHRAWQFTLTRDQLRDALNGSAAATVGAELRSLRITSRDASGRAATLEVAGDEVKTLRGEQLRAAVNQRHGARAIQSTRFTLTLENDTYRFDGTGWGHGVGLCQVGAMARLRRGDPVAAVLATYYPGARLLRVLPRTAVPAPFPPA